MADFRPSSRLWNRSTIVPDQLPDRRCGVELDDTHPLGKCSTLHTFPKTPASGQNVRRAHDPQSRGDQHSRWPQGIRLHQSAVPDGRIASTGRARRSSAHSLILVKADEGTKWIVLEAHARITRHALVPDTIPASIVALPGVSPDGAQWDEYRDQAVVPENAPIVRFFRTTRSVMRRYSASGGAGHCQTARRTSGR